MSTSLKTINIVPLSVLIALQLVAVSMVNRNVFDISLLEILEDTGGVMLAVSTLAGWLSHLIPAEFKSVLVFWRLRNVLPGHRFIQLAEKDKRIDIDLLKTRVSEFESLRRNNSEQNSYWYREFYRPVTSQHEVASTHKSYLLYRDAAAVSLISMLLLIIGKLLFSELLVDISVESLWVFAVAIVGFTVAARNAGQRMVTTAVAVSLT